MIVTRTGTKRPSTSTRLTNPVYCGGSDVT
jgi:hypothetical protein